MSMWIDGQEVAPVVVVEGGGSVHIGYDVTFMVNDEPYYFVSGNTIQKPINPDGLFKGWKNPSGDFVSFPFVPTEDCTLTADFAEYPIQPYIQSTAQFNQYIDTGYVPTQETEFEVIFQVTDTSREYRCPFGAENNMATGVYVWINRDKRVFTGWGSGDIWLWVGDTSNKNFNWFNFTHQYRMRRSKGKLIVEDLDDATFGTQTFNLNYGVLSTSRSVYLFRDNTPRVETPNGAFQISSFKIYENGEVVRDFVPVSIGEHAGAMFEKKQGLLYTNAGSGGDFYAPLEF